MGKQKCCLCGLTIQGRAYQVPLDSAGSALLPPLAKAQAAARGAPDTGWLHNEKGRWCLIAVTDEIKEMRARMARRSQEYAPSEPSAHNVAPRAPREQRNLDSATMVSDREPRAAAVGLLLVGPVTDESVSPDGGAGVGGPSGSGTGGFKRRAAFSVVEQDCEPMSKRLWADKSRLQQGEAGGAGSSGTRLEPPEAARAELAPHERGGVANAIRIKLERAAQGLEPTQGAGKGAPQTLVQKTAPSSRTKEGLMTAEELEVKRARVEDHERIDALEKAVRRLEADAVKVDANMARLQHLW